MDYWAEREKQLQEDAERKWLEELLDAQQKEDEELLRQRQLYFETDPVTEIEHQLLLELEKEHAKILQDVQDGKRAYTDKDYQKYWVPLRRLIGANPRTVETQPLARKKFVPLYHLRSRKLVISTVSDQIVKQCCIGPFLRLVTLVLPFS